MPPSDPTAEDLDAWVAHHQHGIWRFARVLGCAPDLADDIAQEALVVGVQKGIHARVDAEAAAWLRGAVRNLWRQHCRKLGRRREVEDEDQLERAFVEHAAEGGDAWVAAMRVCVSMVPQADRDLLTLRYERDLARDEIARELSLSEEGVKSRLRRLRDRLRDCVLLRTNRGEL